MDRDTGRSRGFGFVEMSTAEANQAVKRFNGHDLDGRQLKVEVSTSSGTGGGQRRTGGERTNRW
jgi:RNA recognition motif-containing protein